MKKMERTVKQVVEDQRHIRRAKRRGNTVAVEWMRKLQREAACKS